MFSLTRLFNPKTTGGGGGGTGDYPNVNNVHTSDASNLVAGKLTLPSSGAVVLNTEPAFGIGGNSITPSFNESARNTDPGVANVKSGVVYKILNSNKLGTYEATSESEWAEIYNELMKGAFYEISLRTGFDNGFCDQFGDQSGVDTDNSENFEYNAVSDFYRQTTSGGGSGLSNTDILPISNETVFSSSNGGGTTPANIFDKSTSTYWQPSAAGACYFGSILSEETTIIGYKIRKSSAGGGNTYTFKLQGSNNTTDGSDGDWTDLDTQTDITLADDTTITILLDSEEAYESFRWYITSPADGGVYIAEAYLIVNVDFDSNTDTMPTMTNATSPSGEVTASTEYDLAYAYKAANDSNASGALTACWLSSNTALSEAAPQWWQYEFATNTSVSGYTITTRNYNSGVSFSPKDWSLFATTSSAAAATSPGDGSLSAYTASADWTLLDSVSDSTVNGINVEVGPFSIDSPDSYLAYRFVITERNTGSGGWSGVCIGEIELHEAAEYIDIIPPMYSGTSNGVTITASHGSDPWKTADDNDATYWDGTGDSLPHQLDVEFGENKVVVGYTILSANTTQKVTAWDFQGSADGLSWTTIESQTAQDTATKQTYMLGSSSTYKHFRLNITAVNGATAPILYEYEILSEVGGGDPLVNNPLTLLSTSEEASAEPTKAYGVVWLKDVGANLVVDGVDEESNNFRIYISLDDGSTWEWMGPLTDEGDISGGSDINRYTTDEFTFSGSGDKTMRVKVETDDPDGSSTLYESPDFELYGWSIIWNNG